MQRKYVSMSKKISLALRHNPKKFGLELGEDDWVDVEEFLSALDIGRDDLDYIQEHNNKKRFEISDGKIRAVYGHSVPAKTENTPEEPPYVLYHGTPDDVANVIMKNGLKPMSRRYVHYSTDYETAVTVGRRRCSNPTILIVDAERASGDGYEFYHGNEDIWMSKEIPPIYIVRAKV